jgi:hypothetical protein
MKYHRKAAHYNQVRKIVKNHLSDMGLTSAACVEKYIKEVTSSDHGYPFIFGEEDKAQVSVT